MDAKDRRLENVIRMMDGSKKLIVPTKGTRELVVDKNGQVRQAGADAKDSEDIKKFKRLCERSLFAFAYGCLGMTRMTPTLHGKGTPDKIGLCSFFQKVPPYRKCALMPRDHLKTTIMKSWILHLFIQQDKENCYFPKGIGDLGHSNGKSTRVLLASKTADLSEATLGEIAQICESNALLPALWPEVFWEDPKKQARYWSGKRIQLNRDDIFKEASVETIGVGGTRTGYHFNAHGLDDLIELEDANSPTVMSGAIEWQKASRAFFDDPERSLENITGTRWAVWDLYSDLKENDPTIEFYGYNTEDSHGKAIYKPYRSIVEDGELIFPEWCTMDTVHELQNKFGPLFYLLYMNEAYDPSLTDFNHEEIRSFRIQGESIEWDSDGRDFFLDKDNKAIKPGGEKKGMTFSMKQNGPRPPVSTWHEDLIPSDRQGFLKQKYMNIKSNV